MIKPWETLGGRTDSGHDAQSVETVDVEDKDRADDRKP